MIKFNEFTREERTLLARRLPTDSPIRAALESESAEIEVSEEDAKKLKIEADRIDSELAHKIEKELLIQPKLEDAAKKHSRQPS